MDSGTTKYGPKDGQNHLRQLTRVLHKKCAAFGKSKASNQDVSLTIELGFLDSGTTKYGP